MESMPGVFKSSGSGIKGYMYQQVVSLSQSSCVSPFELTDVRGGGGGAESYVAESKPGPINHSNTLNGQKSHISVLLKHKHDMTFDSPCVQDILASSGTRLFISQCGMMSIQVHIPVWYDEYSGTYSSVV